MSNTNINYTKVKPCNFCKFNTWDKLLKVHWCKFSGDFSEMDGEEREAIKKVCDKAAEKFKDYIAKYKYE